jgi:chorismate mutase-like protein
VAVLTPIPEDLVISKDHSARTATVPNYDLELLRSKLDDIDWRLLECLRERIACCVEIADLKRRDGVPMMAPNRIAVVQERAARYAAEHDIDAAFLHRLYDLVIAETCRVEDLVISTGLTRAE